MTSAPEQQTALTTTFSNIANNVVSQLAAACAATDVSITLLTGTGASFPPAPFYVSVEYEVLWCSNKTGDVLQVSRGVDGTTAAPHPANAIIQIRNNAGLFLDAYDAIHELDNGIVTGSALPANVAYTDKVQELTHKTIDLTDQSKGNVIIGTVQPDPASLPLQNLLENGGFELWTSPATVSIPAGSASSGGRIAYLCNFWWCFSVNDSSITINKDTGNPDTPGTSYNLLINVNTIQANDVVSIYNTFYDGNDSNAANVGYSNLSALAGLPISVSARIKSLSGNVQVRFRFSGRQVGGAVTNDVSPWFTLTSSYSTVKYENRTPFVNTSFFGVDYAVEFKGTGQIAVDSVMLVQSPVATTYRPRLIPNRTGMVNLITNGGFEVWQKGSSFGTNALTADKWYSQSGGTGTVAVTKETSLVDQMVGGSSAALKIVYTPGSGDTNIGIYQSMTNADSQYGQLAGKVLTATCRIKTNASGVRIWMAGSGSNRIYSAPAQSDNNYHTVALTYPADYTVGGTYFGIEFTAGLGGTAYIDNAMMVLGQVPADYTPMHPADELARCQRYYQRLAPGGGSVMVGSGYANSNAGAWIVIPTKATFPVAPTITVSATSDWGVASGATGVNACTSISFSCSPFGPISGQTGCAPGGVTSGQGAGLFTVQPGATLSAECNA